jgi:hypothetical protein
LIVDLLIQPSVCIRRTDHSEELAGPPPWILSTSSYELQMSALRCRPTSIPNSCKSGSMVHAPSRHWRLQLGDDAQLDALPRGSPHLFQCDLLSYRSARKVVPFCPFGNTDVVAR